jgi:hypothetical protein
VDYTLLKLTTDTESVAPQDEKKDPSWAARSLKWLSAHPTMKLLSFVWVGVVSVAGPLYMIHKDRKEERRLGLLDTPALILGFPGQNCTLLNEDRRPVAEATITFNSYVVDASSCSITGAITGGLGDDHAKAVLAPRDRIQVITDDLVADRCGMVGPSTCPSGHDCRLVVECVARYHRQADLEPQRKTALALSTAKDCKQLRALDTLYDYGVRDGSWAVTWKDTADERAIKCFLRSRPFHDLLLNQHRTTTERAREAIERDLSR